MKIKEVGFGGQSHQKTMGLMSVDEAWGKNGGRNGFNICFLFHFLPHAKLVVVMWIESGSEQLGIPMIKDHGRRWVCSEASATNWDRHLNSPVRWGEDAGREVGRTATWREVIGKTWKDHENWLENAWKMLEQWLENWENDQMIKRCGIEIWSIRSCIKFLYPRTQGRHVLLWGRSLNTRRRRTPKGGMRDEKLRGFNL